ncbi:MAG TPA: hypothetical protein VJ972_04130 [Anaerolineales bacterium]|nr:hypothetical protein [Anaerolineales bacterium]
METAVNKSTRRYVSLRVQIWITFILIFTPVFIASYYWFYQYTSDRVFQTISEKVEDTISGAVQGMDVDSFVQLYQDENTSNPICSPSTGDAEGYYPEDSRYVAHVEWLRTVQQIASSAAPDDPSNIRIYTYVGGPEPGDVVGIGSTGYFRSPKGGFEFCELYNSQGKTQIADGLNRRVDRWDIYDDSFGSWITTYQPITDQNGQNVGAIGVDMPASYVNQVKRSILVSGAIAFIVSYVFIFLLVYWFSGQLTRPIVGLAGVAEDIGEGNYDQEWSISKGEKIQDEIDTLTTVFRSMVEKVAEREKTLRERVTQLEIMVDRSKLESQVSEIVDSDFFQDLKSKVNDMRSRFKDEPTEKKPKSDEE